MSTLTFKFRNADEADACDLTRIGNITGASPDGLTVEVEDVDFEQWREPADTSRNDERRELMEQLGAVRAAMAACGVWIEVFA